MNYRKWKIICEGVHESILIFQRGNWKFENKVLLLRKQKKNDLSSLFNVTHIFQISMML